MEKGERGSVGVVAHAFAEGTLEDCVHELQRVDVYGGWLEECYVVRQKEENLE